MTSKVTHELPMFWRRELGCQSVFVRGLSSVLLLTPEEHYHRFGWELETEHYGTVSVQLVPYSSTRRRVEGYINDRFTQMTQQEMARYLDMCLGATVAAQLLHESQRQAIQAREKQDISLTLVYLKASLLLERRLANSEQTTMDLFHALFELPAGEDAS